MNPGFARRESKDEKSQPRFRGLGRGLDALIPMSSEGEAMVPQMIAVDQIRPSRQQVRSRFDAEPLGELAESIRLHGVLQPLLVRKLADGFELIAGERRWRAARLAGLDAVPAVVRTDAGNDEQLVLGLIENLQRTDLDPIEEARGLRRLIEEFGLTHEDVARRLGKHRVSVTQSLRLLGGCAAVQSAVASGVISAGHARALIALEAQAAQEQGLKVVVAKHLSVRQTENWVRTYRPRRHRRDESVAELRAVAGDVESSLGLPIKISGTLNRGKVELRYSSREELERVCAKLVT
jgi:ParB family transcriptional regulator, chromosome partitioning protein